jgi:hypothetical protein
MRNPSGSATVIPYSANDRGGGDDRIDPETGHNLLYPVLITEVDHQR